MGNFKEDIVKTKAFIFDVDGVMTNGGITPIEGGTDFLRTYNAKDGYAIAYAIRRGYKVCVISGGHGNLLQSRLTRLGVTKMYLNCMDKIAAMQEFFAEFDMDPATTKYMGDDIPDYEVMQTAGFACCPTYAAIDIQRIARYITPYKGGEGCVRDVMEQTLRAQGAWMMDEHAYKW